MYTPPEEPKPRAQPMDANQLAHELALAQARQSELRTSKKKRSNGVGILGLGFGTWVLLVGLLFFGILFGFRYLAEQLSHGVL